LNHCGSPEEAEAEACLQGVRLAMEWVRLPVRVESDCLTLVWVVHDQQLSHAAWAGIVAEIRAAKQSLPECSVNHIRRDANGVAHELAQRAIRSHECVVMHSEAPECVHRRIEVEVVQGSTTRSSCNASVSN
jgi:hypothetical protein